MWDVVAEILTEAAAPASEGLSSADLAAICDALEDAAAAADRGSLLSASETLEQGFRTLLAGAPDAARAAATGGSTAGPAERAAFDLGQINFAQSFAARAFERRADASFADALVEGRHERLVRALAERPMSGVELASKLGLSEETVSRNLKRLRVIGAADYRRDGVQLINFLTPPAASVVRDLNLAPLPKDGSGGMAALRELNQSLDPHLRQAPTFAGDDGGPDKVAA